MREKTTYQNRLNLMLIRGITYSRNSMFDIFLFGLLTANRPVTARESGAGLFPVVKLFSEVSSLLGSLLDVRRREEKPSLRGLA
jgi:hypothetical protein